MVTYGGAEADSTHSEFSGGILHDIARDNRFARELLDGIYADYHAAELAEAATFADGSLVTDADRAELWAGRDAAVCRECGGSGAVLDGGRMRDCPDCGGR